MILLKYIKYFNFEILNIICVYSNNTLLYVSLSVQHIVKFSFLELDC